MTVSKTDLNNLKTERQKEIEAILKKKKAVKSVASLITLICFIAYILIAIYSGILPKGR